MTASKKPDPAPSDVSRLVTLVLGAALLCLVVCVHPAAAPGQWIDGLRAPAASAVRWFEADLERHDALGSLDGASRALVDAALELEPHPLEAALEGYREVLSRGAPPAAAPARVGEGPEPGTSPRDDAARDPREVELAVARSELALRRVVLLAEAGRLHEAPRALEDAARERDALPEAVRERHRRIATSIAGAWSIGGAGPVPLAAADLGSLAAGWARERLALRLAVVGGDAREIERVAAERAQRERDRRAHLVALAGAVLLPLALGALLLLAWVWAGRPSAALGEAAIPPAWSFGDGVGVVVRSALAWAAIGLALEAADTLLERELLSPFGPLLGPLPMLWFVRRRLAPRGAVPFARALGLTAPRGRALALAAWTLGLFAAGEIGARVVRVACAARGVGVHWAELVPERLLAAGPLALAVGAVAAVAAVPLFEEVATRGILYPTLRVRSAPFAAALSSGILFAALHPYSLPVFLSIAWLGFVWALAYERTRSLWPGIACHALINLQALAAWSGYR